MERVLESAQDSCAVTSRCAAGAPPGADARAAATLLPLVYEQLRSIANRKMRQEQWDYALDPTALVRDAYLRLVCAAGTQFWESRWHFYAAAAEAMRRILIERARRNRRLKRGGDRKRIDLEALELAVDVPSGQLMDLNEALVKLGQVHPLKAQLVQLKFFTGLTNTEAAKALGISPSTADRDWAFARRWLFDYLTMDAQPPTGPSVT